MAERREEKCYGGMTDSCSAVSYMLYQNRTCADIDVIIRELKVDRVFLSTASHPRTSSYILNKEKKSLPAFKVCKTKTGRAQAICS